MRENPDVDAEAAIAANLELWGFEIGGDYEACSQEAAEECMPLLSGSQVVDLGCGDGAALTRFIALGTDTLGIDINAEKLARCPGPTIQTDILSWLREKPDDSVPNVFAHHSLEHLAGVTEVLAEIARVLKPGGLFYAVVPADGHLRDAHFTAFEAAAELLPPGLMQLHADFQFRVEPEWKLIARKRSD